MHTLRLFTLVCLLLSANVVYYGFFAPSYGTISVHETLASSVKGAKTSLLDSFMYPNATIDTKLPTKVIMQSSATQETILAWYRKQLEQDAFHLNTYTDADYNHETNYVIAAQRETLSLEISIRKKSQNALTTIAVSQNP